MIDFDQALVPCLIALIIIPQIPWAFLCRYKTKEVKWLEHLEELSFKQVYPSTYKMKQETEPAEKEEDVKDEKTFFNTIQKVFGRYSSGKKAEVPA